MADKSGFRIRLRARIAKGLTTEATSLTVVVANKDVTITSQNKEESLNKAKWIVLSARGFTTQEAAQDFGTRVFDTATGSSIVTPRSGCWREQTYWLGQ